MAVEGGRHKVWRAGLGAVVLATVWLLLGVVGRELVEGGAGDVSKLAVAWERWVRMCTVQV